MTNTYDDEYAKYLTAKECADPSNNCGNTIAARLTGRSDWETITKFYPMVHPAGDQPAPAVLPLDVTEDQRHTAHRPAHRVARALLRLCATPRAASG